MKIPNANFGRRLLKAVEDQDIPELAGRSEIERFQLRQAAMWRDSRLQGYYGLWMVIGILVLIAVTWICESLTGDANDILSVLLTVAIMAPLSRLYWRRVINPLVKEILAASGQV